MTPHLITPARKAWELIADPAHYVAQGAGMAQDASGKPCLCLDPKAARWSVLGALTSVYGQSTGEAFWASRLKLWYAIEPNRDNRPKDQEPLEISVWEAMSDHKTVSQTLKELDL